MACKSTLGYSAKSLSRELFKSHRGTHRREAWWDLLLQKYAFCRNLQTFSWKSACQACNLTQKVPIVVPKVPKKATFGTTIELFANETYFYMRYPTSDSPFLLVSVCLSPSSSLP